ncbi:hypothetical protein R4K55_05245 [Brachyspira alvinipulli]|uniref:hypothetical protein n=1 Tax=Brachyspira alvinipulli TaxID=84379 RepID=UPI003006F739
MKKMFSAFLLLMLLISCTKSNANKYAGVWIGDLGNIIGMAMTVNDDNTVSLPIGSSPVIISNVQVKNNQYIIEDYSFKPETDGAMEASNFTITMTITFESVTNCTINGIMNYGAEDIIINNTMVKK